ncbi:MULTISPECIES: hypothetical protein [unclassified Aeromicrobium]|uniref:hypothetical protein n=1 Tax=unclassified Aeromicrobium TaxID=2633570 RepID=UPI000701C1AE|nr:MULTISPECIES: hypothetical protein [unclassified Aeromicrobium]KQX71734.1 hypothetical protein ASD10_17350 [Aeromicrobium sp. Root472D3]MBD8606718.1 hypothetical protein [Aeromicrobium sp. CFBP 8757]
MSSVRRRRLTAVSLTVVAGLTLTACGTSFGAQTNQVYQPAVGANERGDVESHNTLLVGNRDGSATVSAGLVNNLDDEQTLTGVSVTDEQGESLTVTKPKSPLSLPSKLLTTLGGETPDSVFVVGEGAEPGDYVKVTFTFSDSPELVVNAPVVARADHAAEYDDVAGGDGLVPNAVSGGGSASE